MAAKNGGSDGPVSKYETEEGLKEVAAFLRGRNGMPLRPAIEVDKRVEYFKGETRERERCSPEYRPLPDVTYSADAQQGRGLAFPHLHTSMRQRGDLLFD